MEGLKQINLVVEGSVCCYMMSCSDISDYIM